MALRDGHFDCSILLFGELVMVVLLAFEIVAVVATLVLIMLGLSAMIVLLESCVFHIKKLWSLLR